MDIGLYNMKFYYKYFDNNFFFFLLHGQLDMYEFEPWMSLLKNIRIYELSNKTFNEDNN